MKMKYLNILFVLSAIHLGLNAQITITNSTFPVVGDKLKLVNKTSFSGSLNMGNVSGPQVWDFSSLNSGAKFTEEYKSASTGQDAASFPDAQMVLSLDNQEEYFKSSATAITSLGLGGENPLLGSAVVVRYTKQPTYRSAPLTFIGATKSDGAFNIKLSTDIFPDSLLASLGNFKPDSVRIEFTTTSTGLMDAYGVLNMQGKSIDVLREKSTVSTKTNVFLKVPLLGWQSLDLLLQIAQASIPDFIKSLIGSRHYTDYKFYSNSHKEILVSARYDSLNVLDELIFADLGGVTSVNDQKEIDAFSLYPNPSTEFINVVIPNTWKEGSYLITISDLAGKPVYAEPCQLTPAQNKQIKINNFAKGVYFLTLRDQFNTFTATSKFVRN